MKKRSRNSKRKADIRRFRLDGKIKNGYWNGIKKMLYSYIGKHFRSINRNLINLGQF